MLSINYPVLLSSLCLCPFWLPWLPRFTGTFCPSDTSGFFIKPIRSTLNSKKVTLIPLSLFYFSLLPLHASPPISTLSARNSPKNFGYGAWPPLSSVNRPLSSSGSGHSFLIRFFSNNEYPASSFFLFTFYFLLPTPYSLLLISLSSIIGLTIWRGKPQRGPYARI